MCARYVIMLVISKLVIFLSDHVQLAG